MSLTRAQFRSSKVKPRENCAFEETSFVKTIKLEKKVENESNAKHLESFANILQNKCSRKSLKFCRKNQCWSLFLIKLQAFKTGILLKRNSSAGVLFWNLSNFKEDIFLRNTFGGCFCFYKMWYLMYTCENGFSCNFKQTIDFLKNELGLSQTSISVNKKDTR